MRRAQGWPWRGLGLAAVLVAAGLALAVPGWVLAHLSDAFGGGP